MLEFLIVGDHHSIHHQREKTPMGHTPPWQPVSGTLFCRVGQAWWSLEKVRESLCRRGKAYRKERSQTTWLPTFLTFMSLGTSSSLQPFLLTFLSLGNSFWWDFFVPTSRSPDTLLSLTSLSLDILFWFLLIWFPFDSLTSLPFPTRFTLMVLTLDLLLTLFLRRLFSWRIWILTSHSPGVSFLLTFWHPFLLTWVCLKIVYPKPNG